MSIQRCIVYFHEITLGLEGKRFFRQFVLSLLFFKRQHNWIGKLIFHSYSICFKRSLMMTFASYLVRCQYWKKIKLLWFLYNFALDNQSDMEQRNEQLKCMVKKIVCATTAGKLTLNFTVNQIAPYKHTSHFSFLCLELTFKNVIKRWNRQWNAVFYFSLNFLFVF